MGELMRRFVEEADRGQWTLLPECLDDFIGESNPVRVIDVFVDALDLAEIAGPALRPRPPVLVFGLIVIVVAGFVIKRETSAKETVPDVAPRCAAMLPGAWSACQKTK
jgi:hypothetical protein